MKIPTFKNDMELYSFAKEFIDRYTEEKGEEFAKRLMEMLSVAFLGKEDHMLIQKRFDDIEKNMS